jgi:predicted metalloprotease with PDZ domain
MHCRFHLNFYSSIILLLFAISFTATAQKVSLQYQFSYDTASVKPLLKVKLQCKGNASGKTILQLPDRWASQQDFYKSIVSLAVKTKGALLDTSNGPLQATVTHKPSQELEIEYGIVQDWQGPLVYPNNYRAVIQENYFQLTGYSLFIYPKNEPSVLAEIQLDWKKMPDGWSIGNSLHAATRKYKGSVMLGDLQNSIFTGGDFRLYSTTQNNETIHVAIRGNNWKFPDSSFLVSVRDIVVKERDFWNDHTQPYYFVSLVPFEGRGSFNGSSLYNSFFLGSTGEFVFDINLQSLLAHEYFHRWIGGNGNLHMSASAEQEGYWFSEGFTEYYTYKFLHASGMINRKQYIGVINQRLAEYFLSPLRNKDKKTLGENFWSSRDYQMIPYKKGFTYALYIDWLLQSSSNKKSSLDQLLFDALARAKTGAEFNDAAFVELVKKNSGKDISASHDEWINKGGLIELPAATAMIIDSSFTVQPQPMGAFDLGFDFDASVKAKKVTGIKENSAAYTAGLRDGQKMKGWSVQLSNINVPAVITIADENGKENKISYLPQSAEKISVPQLMVTAIK